MEEARQLEGTYRLRGGAIADVKPAARNMDLDVMDSVRPGEGQ